MHPRDTVDDWHPRDRLRRGLDESDEPPYVDLHSSWSDGEGAYWAVGGDFASLAIPGAAREGVVTRHGCGRLSGSLVK